MNVKTPPTDILSYYDGYEDHIVWSEAGADFICPACQRNKYEIMTWTKRFPNKPDRTHYDWVAKLVRHRDQTLNDPETLRPRFETAIICGQCSYAASAAKRSLGLPKNFSFSPTEIGQFVSASPHAVHKRNDVIAVAVYDKLGG